MPKDLPLIESPAVRAVRKAAEVRIDQAYQSLREGRAVVMHMATTPIDKASEIAPQILVIALHWYVNGCPSTQRFISGRSSAADQLAEYICSRREDDVAFDRWIVWRNEREYGVPLLHRAVGNITAVDMPTLHQTVDINQSLQELYGDDYAPHPRLDAIVRANGGMPQGWLAWVEESEARAEANYNALAANTAARCKAIDGILQRAAERRLVIGRELEVRLLDRARAARPSASKPVLRSLLMAERDGRITYLAGTTQNLAARALAMLKDDYYTDPLFNMELDIIDVDERSDTWRRVEADLATIQSGNRLQVRSLAKVAADFSDHENWIAEREPWLDDRPFVVIGCPANHNAGLRVLGECVGKTVGKYIVDLLTDISFMDTVSCIQTSTPDEDDDFLDDECDANEHIRTAYRIAHERAKALVKIEKRLAFGEIDRDEAERRLKEADDVGDLQVQAIEKAIATRADALLRKIEDQFRGQNTKSRLLLEDKRPQSKNADEESSKNRPTIPSGPPPFGAEEAAAFIIEAGDAGRSSQEIADKIGRSSNHVKSAVMPYLKSKGRAKTVGKRYFGTNVQFASNG